VTSAQLPGGLEIRSAAAELRAMPEGRKLTGYAATWNTECRLGNFREVILPNAFQASIRGSKDIAALWNHSPQYVLGRTRANTLKLSEDERGLAFELDVVPTSYGDDLLSLVRSGNVGGMSFGFTVGKGGEVWKGDLRQLRALTLAEISAVSWAPAYENTTISARSRDLANAASATTRRRLLEIL
jgi:HK97 family phage prohead protease